MISATSPNQEGVEGIDSRSGLDTHRDIGHTSHVYLLVGNSFVLPHQGGTFLSWFATGYISLRNSWVRAAFCLPWSNGTTEGHVNRLKFLKRQMFGRAHLDLLRVKVLHAV